MAINGLGYGGFYSSYRVTDIPQVDVETVKKQEEQKLNEQLGVSTEAQSAVSAPAGVEAKEDNPAIADNRSRIANLEDISLNFNQGEDYSYIGSESEIGDLDMQKAISDMRKDKILEDYQYFVGSAQDVQSAFANDDGKVFLKF